MQEPFPAPGRISPQTLTAVRQCVHRHVVTCGRRGIMNAKKIAIIAAIVVALGAIVGFTITQGQRNLVAVQTAKAGAQDLSSVVTASGEIKAKTYVNIGA